MKIILSCPLFLCIQLLPCYRGYVVDSLKELISLDDTEVTVIERGQSEGIAFHCHKYKGTLQ